MTMQRVPDVCRTCAGHALAGLRDACPKTPSLPTGEGAQAHVTSAPSKNPSTCAPIGTP
jgi:hypothetical protein